MNIFDQLDSTQWEHFAGYYLSSIGYTILEKPSVGPDQGRDLMVELDGIKCLVSCKHYSRSQRAVQANHEPSVPDRMMQHDAEKFIGFYSTSGSDSLYKYLSDNNVNHLILDGDTIFDNLTNVSFSVHQSLFREVRSIKKKIFGQEYRPLLCKCGCGEDLLSDKNSNLSSVYLDHNEFSVDIIWLLDDHNYCGRGKVSVEARLDECFSLIGLNKFIDLVDITLNAEQKVSTKFDEEYSYFLENVHQVIFPVD